MNFGSKLSFILSFLFGTQRQTQHNSKHHQQAVGSPQVKLSGRGLGNLRVTDLFLLAFATRDLGSGRLKFNDRAFRKVTLSFGLLSTPIPSFSGTRKVIRTFY